MSLCNSFTRFILFLSILYFTISSSALAGNRGETILKEGNKQGAPACVSCHGNDLQGNGDAAIPRLTGLNPAYLKKQLRDIKAGTRSSDIMLPIASKLSDDDIDAVVEAIAGKKVSATVAVADAKLVLLGEKIALAGNWSKDNPPCMRCHGPNGTGVGAHFPALAGQHSSYIEAQLEAWRSGLRKNDPNDLMVGPAKRLAKEEIKAVAAYFAQLDPNKAQ